MDDDNSFVPEERNEAGLKLDKRMVRCLSRKALIRRLAVFLEASISFLSFLFFFFFSSSFSSPVLLPVNLIKNLAIARAKKEAVLTTTARNYPLSSLLRYYTPCFLFSRHFSLLRFSRLFSPFLRTTSSNRCNLVPQRTFSSFLRRKYILFHRSLGNFFDRFVEWTSTIFLRKFSRKIMNRERIFSI